MTKKAPSVKEIGARPRKLTKWGVRYGMWYLGLPLLLALAVLDGLLYAIFTYGLDRCYGIFCLL